VTDYNLPDIQLLADKTKRFLTWIPDKRYIILGASNRVEEALYLENVKKDNITVLKRPSGGQTVMLTPNNLIVAVVFHEPNGLQPKDIFDQINLLIISVLEKENIHGLSMKGISDIAIDGKKISGSAIYRSKDALLYHAVLNLGEPATTFERYLKHPTREPDYRDGRKHSEFVTSLKEVGYTKNYEDVRRIMSQSFEASFVKAYQLL
jgi:lipoate-protein ligase A